MIIITQFHKLENSWGEFCAGLWEKEEPDDEGFKISGFFYGTIGKNDIRGGYKYCKQANHYDGVDFTPDKFKAVLNPNGLQADVIYYDSKTGIEAKETARL